MESVVEMMEKGVEGGVFPGAVLLVSRDSRILFHDAFGVADLFSKEKVTKNTFFDLASLTKPLATTMAVLQLVQEKRICLDQELGTLVKAARGSDKTCITVENLLRHESGFPAHRPFYKTLARMPWRGRRHRLEKLLFDEPFAYRPGGCECYSDLGFMVLARMVAAVSGIPLNLFVQERCYDPLGLEDLVFFENSAVAGGVAEERLLRVAATAVCPWRKKLIKAEVHDDNAWAVGGVDGHAGLFGTAFDVWRLLLEIMRGVQGRATQVIKKELLAGFVEKKAHRTYVAGFDTPSGPISSSGSCFSPSSLGHLGFTGTSFWIDPEKSLIVVLLTNRVHPRRSNEKIREFRPRIHDAIVRQLGL